MTRNFVQRGGLWVLAQIVLMLSVVVAGVYWHEPQRELGFIVAGAVFLSASVVCAMAGVVALGRNLTPFPRPSSTTKLVQSGIYRLVRHPLYTSVICGGIGWAVFRESWPALIVGLASVPFFDAKARREEGWLRRQFPEYSSYERRVRRFIPWIY